MTTEPKPMPDEIWASYSQVKSGKAFAGYWNNDIVQSPQIKYIRADRAEPVNRQMLEALVQLLNCPDKTSKRWAKEAITAAEQCQQDTDVEASRDSAFVAIPRELFELLKGLYLNGGVQDYNEYHRTEELLKPYAEQQLEKENG
jgi:hypothetical protein